MNLAAETWNPEPVLLIPEMNKGRLIKPSEILYVEASDNYCRLFLASREEIVVCRTLRSYEEELNPEIFFRCHKSYLVNIGYIKEYMMKNHAFSIVLHDSTILQVARRRVVELKRFLNQRLRSV